MMFSPAEIMILLTAVIGSGAMVAGAGWLIIRIRRLEDGSGPGLVDHLAEQVDALSAQLDASQEELRELRSRVEFAERLLTAGSPPDQDQAGGGGK